MHATSALALFLEDSSGSDGGTFILLILAILLAGGLYGLYIWRKRQDELHAYLKEQNFTATGDKLPPTLIPPSSTWAPDLTIRNVFTGTRNGFEVALFQTHMRQGDSVLIRSMVAVRRPPCTVKRNNFLAGIVTIDQTSTPGWIIASWKGGSRRVPVLEALLKNLTVANPEEEA